MLEGNRSIIDMKVGSIEHQKSSIRKDIDIDCYRTREFTETEVRFEADLVSFWNGKFREPRLISELIHRRMNRQSQSETSNTLEMKTMTVFI